MGYKQNISKKINNLIDKTLSKFTKPNLSKRPILYMLIIESFKSQKLNSNSNDWLLYIVGG